MNELDSRILYCDGACVVVNKIAGEAAEGARAGMVDLPRQLAAVLADADWPLAPDALAVPVAAHRLDVPVSGCVVFARTNAALGALNAAFAGGEVEKHYWAIVEMPGDGGRQWQDGVQEFVHWIEFDSRRNKSIAHDEPGPGRKKAVLRCRQVGSGERYLFLDVEPVTGRHHQIRAQLQRLGLHVKGDLKYGARRSEKAGGIRLHARSLAFPDPSDSSKRIAVIAPPPLGAPPVGGESLPDNLWQAFERASVLTEH